MKNIKSAVESKTAAKDDIVLVKTDKNKPQKPLQVEVANFPAPPKRKIRFRFPRLRTPIFGILALLLARHFVPEIGETLAPVYKALDSFVLPVLNGLYEVAMAILEKLSINAESIAEVFGKVVEWISML